MNILRKSKVIKGTAAFLAAMLLTTAGLPENIAYAGTASYDYSNAIYKEGTEDTYVYDLTDKVVTTKTGISRKIPKTSGKYDVSQYPIPLVNEVPSKDAFELIKAENKELMAGVEEAIQNGTLTKHVAADGQFYGSIADNVLGVEKKVYVNTSCKGTHSLASYVPAGEIATVVLNEEALSYAKKRLIKISMGLTMVDATDYDFNNNTNNRMPYLGKTFSVSGKETNVGTPFGGMLFIEIDSSVPSGLPFEIEVKGVVDTPYYELGQTTDQEWETAKQAPGLFTEIRTPYLRFIVPSYFIRESKDIGQALKYWTDTTTHSATIMAEETRNTPMTLIFDDYITAGLAFASVGNWTCNLPTEWIASALDYDYLMETGNWGLIHEINHHYQGRDNADHKEWGLGTWDDTSEVTNNVLNAISYILYSNIAAYRDEDGLDDWNKVTDPYSALKQVIQEGKDNTNNNPNIWTFAYSTFIHEIGPITFGEVIASTYEETTFNGITLAPYDYDAEHAGKIKKAERYADLAYRICLASGRDYTWYMKEELNWPLTTETVNKIKALGYEEIIPVQSVYAMGEAKKETGRPFYVPSTGYIFDFNKSLVSPGNTKVVNVSAPKYGKLTKLANESYSYTPSSSMPVGKTDEFTLTVSAEAGGIVTERKLNCSIGIAYNGVSVEHHAITKWDVYDALEVLKTSTSYKTTTSTGMKIIAEEGNNLASTTGYFTVKESDEYTFQAFGEDRAVFELKKDDGTTLQSVTVDAASSAKEAYGMQGATHFTVRLEANKAYSYRLIVNNNGGSGWADVNILNTSGNQSWKPITMVSSKKEDLTKGDARSFTSPEPYSVRTSTLAAEDARTLKGVSVISHPQGVAANISNEGNPDNMVDGDESTYFHSAYVESEKTPMPHDYVFDLGSEQTFNQMELLYRRSGDDCGVIGNYEVYVANEYDGSNTKWTLAAKDETRKGNSAASEDIRLSLPATSARYVRIHVLNNRGDYDLSIIAEAVFSMNSTVENVIAQNSSYIQYKGSWNKDTNGAFVNGATYNTKNGSFYYCFKGTQTNLYMAKDTVAEVRIDGREWRKIAFTGSLREPSATFVTEKSGEHSVEVRAIGEEVALNMISTDGTFYKGNVITVNNTLKIIGAGNIKIPVSKVKTFNPLTGISYTDTLGIKGLEVKVSGTVGKPSAGTNKDYKLTYTITDQYGNTTSVNRTVTVTNQAPVFSGLNDIKIVAGEGKNFDYKSGVTVKDTEDGKLSTFEAPKLALNTLAAGEYTVQYKAKDSDGNSATAKRKVIVSKKPSAVKKLKATAVSTSKVKLTWSKVSTATGYKVYRYDASKKKYVLIKTITKNTTVSYTDTKRASATSYKYKVVAYKKSVNASATLITGATKPATVKIKKIMSKSKKATISWSKIKGASGYEVYRSTSKKGKYKKVTTIKKASTVKYTNTKLTVKKTYYYKVRAYKTVNGKKIYGAYSAVKSIKIIK